MKADANDIYCTFYLQSSDTQHNTNRFGNAVAYQQTSEYSIYILYIYSIYI
jgi:hypothetical protein